MAAVNPTDNNSISIEGAYTSPAKPAETKGAEPAPQADQPKLFEFLRCEDDGCFIGGFKVSGTDNATGEDAFFGLGKESPFKLNAPEVINLTEKSRPVLDAAKALKRDARRFSAQATCLEGNAGAIEKGKTSIEEAQKTCEVQAVCEVDSQEECDALTAEEIRTHQGNPDMQSAVLQGNRDGVAAKTAGSKLSLDFNYSFEPSSPFDIGPKKIGPGGIFDLYGPDFQLLLEDVMGKLGPKF
ncbi:MAG: hypothetical protein HQM16_08910 [Deltaproteobacteria bacterium]|nr:hypothetical protein [Deltaproteobacteria bacterium]